MRVCALLLSIAWLGCTGDIIAAGGTGGPNVLGPKPADSSVLAVSEVRRLTRDEYRSTLIDLVGVDPSADLDFLPQDVHTPFDNDYTTQVPSRALVEGANALALAVAAKVVADPTLRSRVVGCTPASATDAACFKSFVQSFGLKALRRPLASSEVDRYLPLMSWATMDHDFYSAVELVLAALLQDPELLYRIEVGQPVAADVVRLTSFELASRLSYFLWGTAPDQSVLDAAGSAQLDTKEGIAQVAQQMLADPKARPRTARFHAMWLGYDQLLADPVLAASMHQESQALISRVVFDRKGSWYDLFRSTETYLDATLAPIYGLPAPATPQWVQYTGPERKGLLSQGAYLAVATKFGDTSPVRRGLQASERLFCHPVGSPPPNVNVDDPPPAPGPDACKEEIYASHRTGGCASCHSRLDGIGFGLERYDQKGHYRETEPNKPSCAISGKGVSPDTGASFSGPAQLADVAIASGQLDDCMTQYLLRFTFGRQLVGDEGTLAHQLADGFEHEGQHFDGLLLALVQSDAFRFRKLP
jgi:hypothetical protein